MKAIDKVEILLVEDSKTQAAVLTNSLRQEGLNVTLCESPSEAFEYLKNAQPDLIISDVLMPEMSGFEFCQRVRESDKGHQVPIILHTALSKTQEVIHAIACGADYFLTKPVPKDLIWQFIQDALSVEHSDAKTYPVQFRYLDEDFKIVAEPNRMATLLLSTYGNAVDRNVQLERARRELKEKKHYSCTS